MPEFNDNTLPSKSDVWNVAQGYTHLKILKPLVEMDKLVKIAIYGIEDIQESLTTSNEIKTSNRIEAIHRLIDLVKEIIENASFALTDKGKENLIEIEKKIVMVEDVIDGISRTSHDQRTNKRTIVINEDHFNNCLQVIRTIKRMLNIPLNESNLIFPPSEEFDLTKIQDDLVLGG